MKFRMAPNSLFAVLLRSPWWVSFLIAGLIALVSRALLPLDYWIAGALSGLTFVVVGCMALWRQWRAPRAADVRAMAAQLTQWNWTRFSAQLEAAWRSEGWTVERARGKADFCLARSGSVTLVAAQRWKAALHGEDAVQQLVDAMAAHDASQPEHAACAGLYLAVGEVSPAAARLAARGSVTVRQGDDLARWLVQHGAGSARP
jgi:restriction system protein